jgi:hypothetical protein
MKEKKERKIEKERKRQRVGRERKGYKEHRERRRQRVGRERKGYKEHRERRRQRVGRERKGYKEHRERPRGWCAVCWLSLGVKASQLVYSSCTYIQSVLRLQTKSRMGRASNAYNTVLRK